MLGRLSLRKRLFWIILLLALTNFAGIVITLRYAGQTRHLLVTMFDQDVAALHAAMQLETALVMQKGFTTYYFLTGDAGWLERLTEHHREFQEWLQKARDTTTMQVPRSILNDIESRYLKFVFARDQVIEFYKKGKKETGAQLHWVVRDQFYEIYRLCEDFKQSHQSHIDQTWSEHKRLARIVTSMAWISFPVVGLLVLLLSLVLYRQMLAPIRQLAQRSAQEEAESKPEQNEIKALQQRFNGLVAHVDQTRSMLEQSQEHLIQTEKLALVGKLAAGFAHSVRNPLTSVKMRLFSLERSLRLSETQREDFDVISEEIRHVDTIVRNFLEFSRRPKLLFQLQSPSEVIDTALQLLRHRIESYGAEVFIERESNLPKIQLDAEQLKEVFVNLFLNACEAQGEGGEIRIVETVGEFESLGPSAIIRIRDSGPGVPDSARERVFEPFFTAKEEGSGLGLSIARSIIEQHGGRILLAPRETDGFGATFIIALPLKEVNA